MRDYEDGSVAKRGKPAPRLHPDFRAPKFRKVYPDPSELVLLIVLNALSIAQRRMRIHADDSE